MKRPPICKSDQPIVLALLAMVTGIIASLAAVLFLELISLLSELIYGSAMPLTFVIGRSRPWWFAFPVLFISGIVIKWITIHVLKSRHVGGLADLMTANNDRQSVPVRSGLVGAALNLLSISSGASVGREGSIIYFASSIVTWLSSLVKFNPVTFRVLLASATASALATAFNTPIAGLIFALELFRCPLSLFILFPVILASTTGTFITRVIYGDYPAFIIPEYHLGSLAQLPIYVGLGVVVGSTALIYMHGLTFFSQFISKMKIAWLWTGITGICVALIGLKFPQVLGINYLAIDNILEEAPLISFLCYLFIAKLLATILSLGSGFGGGFITPSLFLGLLVGSIVGLLLHQYFPILVIDYRPYALAAMAALTGTVLGTPLAFVILIFELTKDYVLALNVLLATITAHFISLKFFGLSFFHWQLAHRSKTG